MTGSKDDLPAFDAGVEGIAGAKPELPPDRNWNDHLSLAGDPGLHGRNILPDEFGVGREGPVSGNAVFDQQLGDPANLHRVGYFVILVMHDAKDCCNSGSEFSC